MKERRISDNHYEITTSSGFEASIKMNPRDSMVLSIILKLPPDPTQHQKITEEFQLFLRNKVGGKIFLQLPSDEKSHLIATGNDPGQVQYIEGIDSLKKTMQELSEKPAVKKYSQLLERHAEKGYTLLQEEKDYNGLYEQLFQFKNLNASFVTPEKIQAGLYSAVAEKKKITDNEFVKLFALYDSSTHQFIATLQTFFHAETNTVYCSDFIVKKAETNKKLAQTLILKSFEAIMRKHPNIQGAWFIAGGDGTSPKGQHFCDTILKSKSLDASLQSKLGVRVLFCPPKELLLRAAHRSLRHPAYTLDNPLPGSALRFSAFACIASAGIVVSARVVASLMKPGLR
jgi:hypothetical protein